MRRGHLWEVLPGRILLFLEEISRVQSWALSARGNVGLMIVLNRSSLQRSFQRLKLPLTVVDYSCFGLSSRMTEEAAWIIFVDDDGTVKILKEREKL